MPQALSIRLAAKAIGNPAISLICMLGFLFGRKRCSPSPRRGPWRHCYTKNFVFAVTAWWQITIFLDRSRHRMFPAQCASATAILTAAATITVLKKNENTPCTRTSRRIALLVMPVSEVCAVMPMT